MNYRTSFYLFIFGLALIIPKISNAQFTVGLVNYDPVSAYAGYNLIYPHNQSNVYLLNNCGEIVHVWEGEPDTRPGNAVYILEDGRIVKTSRPASIANDPIWAGGGGATIEIRDWDNNLEWSYTLNNEDFRLHHDIEVIDNGGEITILAIAWERKTLEEVIAAGRDTTVLESDELWPDYIFEIDPTNNEIVWEWHAWDHLVQDFDPNAANFGVVSERPERIDINYDFDGTGDPDWMHSNAIDYDPQNRQIILSVPNFHEIWIIDHSTNTSEAASSSGGLSDRGGDLMFRWGNPAAYKFGTAADQKLFYQHDAQMILDFIDPSDPNRRRLMVFNNRVADSLSTANILFPTFTTYDWQYLFTDEGYAPADFTQTITHPVDPSLMWSTILSSIQYLPNGNFLIGVGRFGYSFELTPENEIVWEYIIPLDGGQAVDQGTQLTINQNLNFRTRRYPVDFEGFTGRDLSPQGTIETNSPEILCDLIASTASVNKGIKHVFPNPSSGQVFIELEENLETEQINLFSLDGRLLESKLNPQFQDNQLKIDVSQVPTGLYLLMIQSGNQIFNYRLMVQK